MESYHLHLLNWEWEAESPEEAVREAAASGGLEEFVWTVTDREAVVVPADEVDVSEFGLVFAKDRGRIIGRFEVCEKVDTVGWGAEKQEIDYNGWKGGRATWLVGLWVGNDEGTERYWRERVREIWKEAKPQYEWETRKGVAVRQVADELREWVEELVDERLSGEGFLSDMMSVALGEVDWREVAESWLEEVGDESD